MAVRATVPATSLLLRASPGHARAMTIAARLRPAPARLLVRERDPVPVFGLAAYDTAHAPDLGIHARTAIVVDLDTGRVLYAKDPTGHRAPASLTKLMTAMVALDSASMSTLVTVSEAAAGQEPSRMGLTPGEVLPVRDLLAGALLDSGNDAAYALADGLMPLPTFLARMNQKASTLHLRDTHFATPNGLDSQDLYSSAYDLAVIAAAVVRNYPELAQLAATKDVVIPATDGHKAFYPHNRNHFLDIYQGATGLKTGFTGDAGGCLIATATRGKRHLLTVLMGSDIMFGDGPRLMDYGFNSAG